MMPQLGRNTNDVCSPNVSAKISMTTWLKEEKKGLETRLEEVNKTLKAMEENPQVAIVIDSIAKLSNY